MNIIKQYLTVSNYNRPGTKRGSTNPGPYFDWRYYEYNQAVFNRE
nr:MAG TPA: hypothetical protein [Caudoviricetes sp.]